MKQPESISIRPVDIKDLETLVRLSQKTFYDAFASQNKQEDIEQYIRENLSAKQLEEELIDNQNNFFFILLDDVPVGYMKLRSGFSDDQPKGLHAVELQRLYVVNEYQNLKLGYTLIQYAINFARNEGYEAIWLGVWEKNSKAIRFYQREGFTQYATHSFLLGNDLQIDWLMKLDLRQNKAELKD
jgi:hypothetical protein